MIEFDWRPTCLSCGVAVGGEHGDACAVARCLATGQQRKSCTRPHEPRPGDSVQGHGRDIWTGYPPGEPEVAEFGHLPTVWDQVARRWRESPVTEIDDSFYVQWHLDRGISVPRGSYRLRSTVTAR